MVIVYQNQAIQTSAHGSEIKHDRGAGKCFVSPREMFRFMPRSDRGGMWRCFNIFEDREPWFGRMEGWTLIDEIEFGFICFKLRTRVLVLVTSLRSDTTFTFFSFSISRSVNRKLPSSKVSPLQRQLRVLTRAGLKRAAVNNREE